jgi:hypothetical protein
MVGQAKATVYALFEELWVPGISCPDVLERFAKLDNCHLRSILRDFALASELFAPNSVQFPA